MARVRCQACGGRTEEGAFCDKCGASPVLDPAAAQPSQVASNGYPAQPRPADSGDTVDETPTSQSVFIKSLREEPPRTVVISSGAPPSSQPAFDGSGPRRLDLAADDGDFDDCPWLHVERDTMAFCVAGTNGLLRLRLLAKEEGVQDVRVDLYLPCATGAAVQPVELYRPKVNKAREYSLTIPPLKEGPYAAQLILQFTKDGVVRKYASPVELHVYPTGSSAKQIAGSIVFNITNDIKMGHASDFRQSLDAASLLGKIADNGQVHGVSELLDLLKTDLRAYKRLSFDEMMGGGNRRPPAEALADRLTLHVGGRWLHLIADRRVTLGRNRTNRITTRLFDRAGSVSSDRSALISKFHCILELDGSECVIYDGAPDECGLRKPSAGGVSWQGKRVKDSVRFPVGAFPQAATLGLAGDAAAPVLGLTARGYVFDSSRCATCESRNSGSCNRGRNPAVVLSRTDDVQECYVLLWACLDVGRVFPECAGLVVCYEQGAFSWRSGGAAGWLTPGRFASAGAELSVLPFAQFGL